MINLFDDIMEEHYNFNIGDSVLVYCNSLLYEGICMERGKTEFGYKQYFIHYKGWNKHWDEWVHEVEILEMNAINYGHKQRLQEKYDEKKKELKEIKNKKKNGKANKKINGSLMKKKGRSKKAVGISNNIIIDENVKDKNQFQDNDIIIGSTPNSSTVGSGIETKNKTINLTN